MKPFVWMDGGRWYVSPRESHGVSFWKPYPGTNERGYDTLVEAADAARLSIVEIP